MLRSLSERDILRDRMTVRAVPQIGLKGLPAEEAIPRLRDAWAQTFMPHDGHLDIGLKFVARARSFASVRYRQMQSYQEERYEGVLPGLSESESLEVWCLTGLAGVSKTSLFAALRRAFEPAAGDWVPMPGIHIHPRPVVHIQIKPKQTADEVVRALANPLFVAGRTNIKWVDMKRHLHDWLHGQMTALVFLDELQFLSRSESASTLIANLVSQLADLGFPLTYGCNFSLGHKLVGRQHEDKDRLLTHPLVLQPPRIDDSHWARVVAEYQCAAIEMVDIDPRRDAPELYRLCGGLYRVLRLLLIASCRMAWPSKADRPISMPDIRAAYRSHLFASQRADIEALNTMLFSAQARKKRPDLSCPFESFGLADGRTQAPPDLTTSPPVPQAALVHLIESSISAGGRQALAELREAGEEVSHGKRARAKVSSISRRPPVTAESLLVGVKQLRKPPAASEGET